MAKIFEDDYSIKYVIIKAKQEMVEERGRYNATRIAWKMKLDTIKQYPYVLSVTEGIVKAVYKVDVWKMAGEVGEPDRVMFEGTEVKDEEITKKFVGKMIPECYRKKGQASPVLYQKREGEADTEDEVAASAKAEKPAASSSDSAEQKAYAAKFEAVDLGLSVKWANMNIGAEEPSQSGDFFAWGEVAPKQDYSWKTYKLGDGTAGGCTKYFPIIDDKNKLDKADDVAHKKMGGKWRMPSKEEFEELKTKCQWQWLSSTGRTGYIVKGPNGNSIFLPAAGLRDGSSLSDEGEGGRYWSSSLNASQPEPAFAWGLYFHSSSVNVYSTHRYYGRCVRPVCE